MVNRYRFFHLVCGLVLAMGGGILNQEKEELIFIALVINS